MKLFSTLIQRIATIVVVLVMAFNVNAENYTFATIAEMHASTNLKDGDKVTITGDVVFEYSYLYYFVVSDKEGTASCMNNYCYYIGQVVEKNSLKAGDVLKNYSGEVVVSVSGVYRLEPDIDTKNKIFGGGVTIEKSSTAYEQKTTKVTVKDLLDTPALYDGKVVSLDLAYVKNSCLIQGQDTLKGFVIKGLDGNEYPTELVIKQALFRVDQNGNISLNMHSVLFVDFDCIYKTIKSFKAVDLTEDIPFDLTVQVLKREVYEGKTYLTVFEGEGNKINCAGLRILLNTENAEDKKIKVGDIINLKSSTVKYEKSSKSGLYFTHSLVTLDEHETVILGSESIPYFVIDPDDILMLEMFEFLPITINGELVFTGKENTAHKEHNFAQAKLNDANVYVDITNKPVNITDKFYVNGILEIPFWVGKVMNPVYIIPLSSKDFFSNLMEFDNIASVIKEGAPVNPIVKYQINSDMTIVGISNIEAVGEEDANRKQDIVFVKDETDYLMLKGKIDPAYKVGDVIKGVVGEYKDVVDSKITLDGVRNFGVARNLTLDETSVISRGTNVTLIEPEEVTIAQLLASDDYVSKVVKLTDFTFGTVTEVVQTITVERHFIYQGEDSIAVDESFVNIKDKTFITAIYYLNEFYTRLIPYGEEYVDKVKVENIVADNTLFILDNTIFAQGAEIEVYDVMGRLVATGCDVVAIENLSQNIFIVKTKYSDGQMFVTKVANR